MSAGGFMFGQASVTYNSATYTTKRDWALAVHKARCDAFLLAQKRAQDKWSTIQTVDINEFSDTRTIDGTTVTLYIQDYHPLSSDTTGAYPAFVSYFEHEDGAEYCIITANGMHQIPSKESDITYGMYIYSNYLVGDGTSSTNKFAFYSLAHCYANNGFNDYNFGIIDTPNSEQLAVCPIMGFDGKMVNNSSQRTSNSGSSLVYNPTQGVTYYFGYAIRGTVIEVFYRASNYDSNTGWNWSLIGPILMNPASGHSTAMYCYYGGGSSSELMPITTNYYPSYSGHSCIFQCINSSGEFFPQFASANVNRYPRLSPGFWPSFCSTSLPSELPYSAGFLSFTVMTSVMYTESFVGIDGNGGCFAGFIDTDILRIVPRPACTVGGSIYQGGNFVCPAKQIAIDQCNDFGVLLGWDYMNESIV